MRRVSAVSVAGRPASSAADVPRIVVSTETGGLGNRLKSWVSAMRLGNEARVLWQRTPNMPARFEDLFTNACAVEAVPPGALEYASWRLAILPEDEAHLPAGFTTVGARIHPFVRGLGRAWWQLRGRPDDRYRYMLFPKQHSRRQARADDRQIDLEYERIPAYFRELYTRLFARIAVRAEIRAVVDAWAARHLDEDVVGVQVRTWRDDPRRYRKYHLPALKRLRRLMDRAGEGARFFVVSDSDELVAALAAERGADRVLHYPRRTARVESWRSVDGMREDLIDMLVLARTHRLLVSYLSTFGEAAWWLGGAAARVEVF